MGYLTFCVFYCPIRRSIVCCKTHNIWYANIKSSKYRLRKKRHGEFSFPKCLMCVFPTAYINVLTKPNRSTSKMFRCCCCGCIKCKNWMSFQQNNRRNNPKREKKTYTFYAKSLFDDRSRTLIPGHFIVKLLWQTNKKKKKKKQKIKLHLSKTYI